MTNLRSEIKKQISIKGMNYSKFSDLAGMNRSVFSLILNSESPKPISLKQLEQIGRALGHNKGWMFEAYIDECFYGGRPNRSRIEPFLIRCAEMNRIDYIKKVLHRLPKDARQSDILFDIAERLYSKEHIESSLTIYSFIVEEGKSCLDRIAICHFRIFWHSIGNISEKNLRAILRFEPFFEMIPFEYKLDASMRLINLYISMDKREKIKFYRYVI